MHAPLSMTVHQQVPLLGRKVFQGRHVLESGVVDQHIDVPSGQRLHDPLNAVRTGHVQLERFGLASLGDNGLCDLVGGVPVKVGYDHVPAIGGGELRQSLPDPTACSGDQHDSFCMAMVSHGVGERPDLRL